MSEQIEDATGLRRTELKLVGGLIICREKFAEIAGIVGDLDFSDDLAARMFAIAKAAHSQGRDVADSLDKV